MFEKHLRSELERQYRGGKDRYLFEDMVIGFSKDYMPHLKPRTQGEYNNYIKNLIHYFGGIYTTELTKQNIMNFARHLRDNEQKSDGEVIHHLTCLSSIISYGIDEDMLDHNYVPSVRKKFRTPKARSRYLSRDEARRLIEASNPRLQRAIRFAIATGMRLEEQLSLKWSDVDLEKRQILLKNTKNREQRIVTLNDLAVAQLSAQFVHPLSDYVFCKDDGSRYKNFKTAFKGAARRAKIKDVTWKDLRKTCGSWMLQSGVDIFVVSRFLGHKDVKVTQESYAFLDLDSLHKAGVSLNSYGTKAGTGATDSDLQIGLED